MTRPFVHAAQLLIAIGMVATVAMAQEGVIHADFRIEGNQIANSCGLELSKLAGCGVTLATDTPAHFSVGSLPPQNGLGMGLAVALPWVTNNWRMNWDADGVVATNGSWRAGLMLTMSPSVKGRGVISSSSKHRKLNTGASPVYRFYFQSSDLATIDFYGIGNDTLSSAASAFSIRETIAGASAVQPIRAWPMAQKLDLSFLGSVNERFVNVGEPREPVFAPLTSLYTEATAPGINRQPAFFQATEGVRITPKLKSLRLDYSVSFDEFEAASNDNSFTRWTIDLNHTLDLFGSGPVVVKASTVGPDQCAEVGIACPSILPKQNGPRTRNRFGSLGFECRLVESATGPANSVPFYFQPTLGGSDINGVTSLGSYADYRYRAPNLLLFRESFESSIWGPFGFEALVDEGRVAVTRSALGFDGLHHSYAAGVTLRAGGFPLVHVLFAWGGNEGTHTILGINSALLGGGSRPTYD